MTAVNTLLAAGADPNKAATPHPNLSELPLHAAARGGHAEVARALLRAGASTINLSGSLFFPLHLAARSGDVDTVKALLDGGADVDTSGREEFAPPLFDALRVAKTEADSGAVARTLLRGGADPNYVFKTRHRGEFTPLRVAVETGCPAGITALLEAGADPNGKFPVVKLGYSTPLHWASRLARSACLEALLRGGSDPNLEESVVGMDAEGCVVELKYTPADVVGRGNPCRHVDGTAVQMMTTGAHDLEEPFARQSDPATRERIRISLRKAARDRSGWGRRGWLVMIRDRRASARHKSSTSPDRWLEPLSAQVRAFAVLRDSSQHEDVTREAVMGALCVLWDERKCKAEERALVKAAEARKKRIVEKSRASLCSLQRSFYGAVTLSGGIETPGIKRKLINYQRCVEEMRRQVAESVSAHLEATAQRSKFVMNAESRMKLTEERTRALELELSTSVEQLTRNGLLPDGLFRAVVAFL